MASHQKSCMIRNSRLLHPILNSVYNTCQPPAEFLLNRIVALPKKGDLSQYGSYRGISLMSCAAKLFNRVLLNRIKDPIERLLRPNQNGFRQGRSTLEPILAIRRLIEALSAKRDASLCAVFVDFTKAFDSVHRERMFTILGLYGIPPRLSTPFAVSTQAQRASSQHPMATRKPFQ